MKNPFPPLTARIAQLSTLYERDQALIIQIMLCDRLDAAMKERLGYEWNALTMEYTKSTTGDNS